MFQFFKDLKQAYRLVKGTGEYALGESKTVLLPSKIKSVDPEEDTTEYAGKQQLLKAFVSPVVYSYLKEEDPESLVYLGQVIDNLLKRQNCEITKRDLKSDFSIVRVDEYYADQT